MVDNVNYFGKLIELGTKRKFVVDSEVTDAPSVGGTPCFKCTIRIVSHDVLVEQIGSSKKAAKAAAAQIAYEETYQKVNASNGVSVSEISTKLKSVEIVSDKVSTCIEFAKKLASIDVTNINVDDSYSELNQLVSDIQCSLSYKHEESKVEESVEFQFVCEVRPTNSLYPVVSGYGWSCTSLEEAKTKAVTQLLKVIGTFSDQPPPSD